MDLWTLIRILDRRWAVVLPGIIATLVAGIVVFMQLESLYDVSSQLAIVPAEVARGQPPRSRERSNAFGQLGGSTSTVIREFTQRKAFEQRLKNVGATSNYEVLADPDAPILRVTTTDHDSQRAVWTMTVLLDTLKADLIEHQQALEVPREKWFTVESILRPEAEPAALGRKLRPVLAVLGLGGIATLGLAVLAEGLSSRHGVASGGSVEPEVIPGINSNGSGGNGASVEGMRPGGATQVR